MRTTINLPDALAEAVKARAAAEHRTFTSLVEEGLRAVLQDREPAGPAEPLPAYGDRSGRFRIHPADRDALWAALDADGPR
jgi:plasmid stability protein